MCSAARCSSPLSSAFPTRPLHLLWHRQARQVEKGWSEVHDAPVCSGIIRHRGLNYGEQTKDNQDRAEFLHACTPTAESSALPARRSGRRGPRLPENISGMAPGSMTVNVEERSIDGDTAPCSPKSLRASATACSGSKSSLMSYRFFQLLACEYAPAWCHNSRPQFARAKSEHVASNYPDLRRPC